MQHSIVTLYERKENNKDIKLNSLTSAIKVKDFEEYSTSAQADEFRLQVSFGNEHILIGSAPTKTCRRSWNAAGISDKLRRTYKRRWWGPNSPIILKTWSNSIFAFHRRSNLEFSLNFTEIISSKKRLFMGRDRT